MTLRATIAGSYHKHLERILEVRKQLEAEGIDVLRPEVGAEPNPPDDVVLAQDTRLAQFAAIDSCDFLYIVNPGGYIGPASTLEAGYAYRAGVPVFSQEMPSDGDVAAIVSAFGEPAAILESLQRSQKKN